MAFAGLLTCTALHGSKGKTEDAAVKEDRPLLPRVAIAGLILTVAILIAYLLYFKRHDPPFNPVVQVIYDVFEALLGI